MTCHPSGTDPARHATLRASAGTGKTTRLVDRVVRILLEGSPPGSILAITFTRKAACEMRQRIEKKLLDLARMDDVALPAAFQALGCEPTEERLSRARRLHETCLFAHPPIRATTFHAFCHEVLNRFSQEAGLPPDCALAEDEGDYVRRAWFQLEREVLAKESPELGDAVRALQHELGPVQTRAALEDFLKLRADWWAFTADVTDAAEAPTYAAHVARAYLPDTDPDFRSYRPQLQRYRELLGAATTATLQKRCHILDDALTRATDGPSLRRRVTRALLTDKGAPFDLKISRDLHQRLGAVAAHELITLHASLAAAVNDAIDHERALRMRDLTAAWCRAGARLLDLFQALKWRDRVVDFTDLEWRAAQLLSNSEHAAWVHYRLDERIRHILVDEFQDTNPTQWRLLQPLLGEVVAGGTESRSAFLVGDAKQSIYRFRRARPELFEHARAWLATRSERIDNDIPLDKSYRSSSVIMDFVNRVFTAPDGLPPTLPDFQTHDTHRADQWGHVEVLPLAERGEPDDSEQVSFRDPLREPRHEPPEDTRAREEAVAIADRIHRLVGVPITDHGRERPLGFGDVMILTRARASMPAIEAELRARGIPCVSTASLEDAELLELKDLRALCAVLLDPADTLALAQTLRSPLFAATDDDLLTLVRAVRHRGGTWYARLTAPGSTFTTPALQRARALLPAWRDAATLLPVHDLLDRIFSEGEVLERYTASVPTWLRGRVTRTLSDLLAASLDHDHGRYPSLYRFLDSQTPRPGERASDRPPDGTPDAVRLMTVHAAKGLEAAAIFVADAARGRPSRHGAYPLVRWPVNDHKPQYFMLAPSVKELPRTLMPVQDEADAAERQESMNLLYVALTRARHALFVSGRKPARDGRLEGTWYAEITQHLAPPYSIGSIPAATSANTTTPVIPTSAVPASASAPRTRTPAWSDPPTGVPDESDDDGADGGQAPLVSRFDARHRGDAVHMALRLLASGAEQPDAALAAMLPVLDDADRRHALDAARTVIRHPGTRHFFGPERGVAPGMKAFNELTVLQQDQGAPQLRTLDRLLVSDAEAWIIDYKTHRARDQAHAERIAARFTPQLERYARAVEALWPGRVIRRFVLFTRLPLAVELDTGIQPSASPSS